MTDYDKICAAVSILQTHILSLESTLDPAKMFGGGYMPMSALEMVLKLLEDILERLE